MRGTFRSFSRKLLLCFELTYSIYLSHKYEFIFGKKLLFRKKEKLFEQKNEYPDDRAENTETCGF